jgi:Family of unknown function (DUF5677)
VSTGQEPDGREELFPQPDPLEVEETFRAEFTACRDLLVLAWDRKPAETPEVWQHLLLAIFARSTLTFRAVMQLCRGGYGEQADMLNRSLFEDMAAAHWISLYSAEALDRIEQHHQHTRVLWNRVIERQPGLGEPVDLGLDEESVAELDETFGRHAHRPWIGLNMFELVSEIEQLWPDDEGRKQLWRFYELAHRANNQKLHLTSFSLNRVARARQEGDETTFQYRASPETSPGGPVSPALFGAFWIYVQLTGLIFDVFGIPQDELTQLVERHMPALAETSKRWSRLYQTPEGD